MKPAVRSVVWLLQMMTKGPLYFLGMTLKIWGAVLELWIFSEAVALLLVLNFQGLLTLAEVMGMMPQLLLCWERRPGDFPAEEVNA